MFNFLSIDLESWAMPNLKEYLILSGRVKKKLDNGNAVVSTLKILDLLKKNRTKITFFIVGQIFEWYPRLIERIAAEGHEIGFHTYSHDPLPDADKFRQNFEQAKNFIQKFKPIGFRAPRINLNRSYFKILKEYGFKYDSSTYGKFGNIKYDGVSEFAVSSFANIPVGSGYFIGLLGSNIKYIYRFINRMNRPVVSFLHNWQIVKPIKPDFPDAGYLLTHPHYFPYLTDCYSSFNSLLKNFTFKPMKNLLS